MATKQTLLYIITKSDLGGAQEHVLALINAFHQRYDVHLAVGAWGPLTEKVKPLGITVHLLPSLIHRINPFTDLQAVRECFNLLKTIQPDIIHVHSSKAGIIGRLAGRIAGIPTIFTCHGWGFIQSDKAVQRWIALIAEKLMATITNILICVCEYNHQIALKFEIGSPRSLVTIHNGLPNLSMPTAKSWIQPARGVMVARFDHPKDQATLLEAIALLDDPTIHVDFVGSGSGLEACQQLAQSLGITQSVSFLGDCFDVPNLLGQYQFFVLSSKHESLPISILEAMRAGLPVIATEVGGVSEIVVDGQTGLLVPHSDSQAMASALKPLIESPELRQKMGRAGRERFLEKFTLEQMIAQTEHVYLQILNQEDACLFKQTPNPL